MSISSQIIESLPDVISTIQIDKDAEVHGEPATIVKVALLNGKVVEGSFTKESRSGFGGVEFHQTKDIAALMIHKIRSVMNGTAEISNKGKIIQ